MRAPVGGAQIVVGGEHLGALDHQLRRLEERHRGRRNRVGEVVERGERGAVGEPRRRRDHRRRAAHASRGDADDVARATAELRA